MADLIVEVADLTLEATWSDENPATRAAIEDALPLTVDAARWGEELYGSIPVEATPEATTTAVPPGTIAYWPAGSAICLFWGPTPASTDETPVAAGPVGIIATADSIDGLAAIDGGARMVITAG